MVKYLAPSNSCDHLTAVTNIGLKLILKPDIAGSFPIQQPSIVMFTSKVCIIQTHIWRISAVPCNKVNKLFDKIIWLMRYHRSQIILGMKLGVKIGYSQVLRT